MQNIGPRAHTPFTFVLCLACAALMPPQLFGQSAAEALSASFRKAADRVGPAVVTVRPLDPGARSFRALHRRATSDRANSCRRCCGGRWKWKGTTMPPARAW